MIMKKIRKFLLLILLSIIFMPKVWASTCSDSRIMELTSAATNVKVNYEEYKLEDPNYVDEIFGDNNTGEYPHFYVTIHNLTDDLNAVILREDTKKSIEVYSKDKDDDGVIYVDAGAATSVKNFKVTIRSNNSNCKNEVLRTAVVTIPMYNVFSEYDTCVDYPDFELCKKFVSSDYKDLSDRDFTTKLEKYKEDKKEEEKRQNSFTYKVAQFLNQYGIYIIIALIVMIAAVIYYLIRRKKRRLV